MRARNIKPSLCKNEVLGKADVINTYIFEGLWMYADREGRLEDRPERIHAEINPYRPEASTVQALDWLCAEHFIVRYRVNGAGYIWIPTFLDHQNPHVREPPSKLPAPEKTETKQGNGEALVQHGASIVPAPGQHQSGTGLGSVPDRQTLDGSKGYTSTGPAPVQHKSGPADSLIPDSLIPDSGFIDSLIPDPGSRIPGSGGSSARARPRVAVLGGPRRAPAIDEWIASFSQNKEAES